MRKITIEDLYSFNWTTDPAISPDGSHVVYTQMTIDSESKEYRSRIYLVASDASTTPRTLSGGPKRDSTPRWSPCGTRLAFVSDRSGENQIWYLNLEGGEATQLTTMRYGAGNPVWSPDGTKIAFTASMLPIDALETMFKPLSQSEKEADAKYKKEHGLVVENLQYRSDDSGFLTGRFSHIWVLDLASGKIVRLTDGKWHHQSFSWSPCNSKIVFAANRNDNPEQNPWDSDLWIASVEGGDLKKLTNTDGPCNNPVWSPDGTKIAYLGHRRDFSGATLSRVWVVDAISGETQCLSTTFDQGFNESITSDMTRSGGASRPLIWYSCGTKLLANSCYQGSIHLYSIALDGTVERVADGDRIIYGWSLSSCGHTLALAWGGLHVPNEVSVLDLKTNTEKRLTKTNPWLDEVKLSETQMFWCKGDEGWDVQGWLMKPIGWQEGKKYPLILSIHGGPHGMYGYAFNHIFQVMAAEGFFVLYLNPRGSHGSGQKFQHGVIGKYGEGEYRDLMAGVDYVLANEPTVDPSRLGVTGASYGGFMTNWIVGHTDRFKVAVTQASISNWVSFFGTSDIGFHFCDNQHGSNPLSDFDAMVRFSPITYVKNVVTPLLIIHNEQDYRCPIEQGEQLFVSLKKLEREVKMVRFNNASHGLAGGGMPALRIDRLKHILGWFKEHIERPEEDYTQF